MRCAPSSGAAGATSGRTNLFGADLCPDVLSWAARVEDVGCSPFAFYRKCGFVSVGLIPDGVRQTRYPGGEARPGPAVELDRVP